MSDARKFKAYLWDCEVPTLIFPWPTRVIYCQQAGGCGCYAMEQEGFIIPFQMRDVEEYTAFNPLVWYEKSIGYPFPPPKGEVPDIKDLHPSMITPDNRPYDQVAAMNRAWKADLWFEDVCEQIEGMEEPCRQVKKIRVKRGVPQMEAWLQVEAQVCLDDVIVHPKYKWMPAILTWANCD